MRPSPGAVGLVQETDKEVDDDKASLASETRYSKVQFRERLS